MKQHPYQYYMQPGYEIYYKTPRQPSEKYRHFDTLEELEAWCKRHKGNARPTRGSWQALELLG